MQTKQVEYSYPTSPNAEKFNMSGTGCYTVELVSGTNRPVALSGHKTLAGAMTAARQLKQDWRPLWLRYRKDWLAA